MTDLGIYVHVPFCKKKCGYCDFCSVTDCDLADAYTERICADIAKAGGEHSATVDSIYFGGGTPTVIGKRLITILDTIKAAFTLSDNCEITVEANPATADFELLEALYNAGVNRLSVGIQSSDDGELKTLGRIHDFTDAVRLIISAKAAGFTDISGDIMLAIPGQTFDTLAHTVSTVASLGLTHISAYLLKIEPNTPFAKNPPENLPDDEEAAQMYLFTLRLLEKMGYKRYEISNFALPKHECRHNLRYWNLGDYIGFGPSAHSLINSRRLAVTGSVQEYIDGKSVIETRDNGGDLLEYVMLSLRTSTGLNVEKTEQRFGVSFKESDMTKALIENGYLSFTDNTLVLTDIGILVSNGIIAEISECFLPQKMN